MATGPAPAHRVVGGRYEIADELGRGGMGVVWLANDRVLTREVPLKEISYPVHLTDDERAVLRERTLREARAAARLEDPHVVAIHDVVEEDGRPWLVMEHVPSRSLQRILEEDGPLAPEQAARIGLDVLSAIDVAHAAGVVHRDVKPANVLVDEGDERACLTDFGIATTAADPRLTSRGTVLGSPSYMAPERVHGEPQSPAVDCGPSARRCTPPSRGARPSTRRRPWPPCWPSSATIPRRCAGPARWGRCWRACSPRTPRPGPRRRRHGGSSRRWPPDRPPGRRRR